MFNPKKLVPITAVAGLAAAAFAFSAIGQQPNQPVNAVGIADPQIKPYSSTAVGFAETDAVRDLPDGLTDEQIVAFEPHEVNELNTVRPKMAPASSSKIPSLDSTLHGLATHLLNVAVPTLVGPPLASFDGLSDQDNNALIGGRVAPSDENLSVGPRDVVQTVNDGVRVFDKSGNPRINPKLISSLFKKLGGVCATIDRGDPIVQHDRMSDRWVISQFNFASQSSAPYHECIAVSKTSDPTGAYYAYDFVTFGNEFPDYPHLGTWPDGYYMTVNQFTNGGAFNGTGCYAFNRAKMLVGDPTANYVYFGLTLTNHPEGIAAVQPSDMDGFSLPPPGAPNTFAYMISNELESAPYNVDGIRLFDFHADFNTPANSTFTERTESPVLLDPYDPRWPGDMTGTNQRQDIKQPPGSGPTPVNPQTDALDAIPYHVMYRLEYRRLYNQANLAPINENLVGSFTVNVSGAPPDEVGGTNTTYQAGVRYFQLRKATAASPYTKFDNATFSPDAANPLTGLNRWLPSAAIDNQGNLAVSYSGSSTTVFPSIFYAGRDFNAVGAPTANLSGEQTLYSGTASQSGSGNRWGDYQSLQVDPTDDCTFWTTNQYYNDQVNNSFNWRTRIGSFKFPTCTQPAQGTVTGKVTSCETGAPISGAIVQINNGFSGATGPDGTYSIQLAASSAPNTSVGYTATISDPSRHCNPSATSSFSIFPNQTSNVDICLSGVAQPLLDNTDPSAVVVNNGANTPIYPNSCNIVNVRLQNVGCATAKNTTATLTTSTPGVKISAGGTSPYANIPIDGSSFNSIPFQFSTDPSFPCATPIKFTLTATFAGGTTTSTFTVATSCGTAPTQTFTASTDPTKNTVNGRTGRANPPSSCGAPKGCPGVVGNGPRSYNVVQLTNGPGPSCITVNPTSPAGTGTLVASAYLGTFDPTDTTLCKNYLADQGAALQPFSFNVAANTTFSVVVEEAGAGATNTPFTIQVSGLSAPPPPGNGQCAAGLTTHVVSAAVTLGNTVGDTATLATGGSPTGTITFRLFGPNVAGCSGAPIFTSVQTVNGDGVYASTPFQPGAIGTYNWIASYSGDANNPAATGACGDPNENVTVSTPVAPTPPPPPVTPTLTTQASSNVTVGGSIYDTATLAGGNAPTGNITFQFFGPNDASCGSAPIFTSTVAVNGNGNYESGAFTPTAPGTYRFIATYNGDAANNGSAGACNAPGESVTVSAAPTPTPTATPTATPTPTATATPAAAAVAQNLSTRVFVGTGDSQAIEGFIVTGGSKQVIIRGIGPALTQSGVSGVLADPVLELHGPDGAVLATNNDWRDTQEAQVKATGLAPTYDVESAIVVTLPAGNYTAILSGNGGTTGIGLVEVYDLDTAGTAKLSNLSTRGFVQTGDRVMIGGFILGKNAGNEDVIVRGIGPSLAQYGVSNPLADPTLELRDKDGTLIRSNNDYNDDPAQASQVAAAGLTPADPRESAIAATLPPGNYTAILAGRNGGTGVGLVEVYAR